MFDLKHQGGLVMTSSFGVGMAYDGKTGGVTNNILNIFSQYGQAVVNARLTTRYCGSLDSRDAFHAAFVLVTSIN